MAGLIPDHVLDQVRRANDIVDVIGQCVPHLKKAGASWRALCPFHKEKTPSFHVNPQRQLFKCFGCGVGGDVITFVMRWDGLEFREAVEQLARRANIPLEYDAKRDRGMPSGQKELLFKLHEEAAAFFHWQLMKEPAAQIARDYLTKRKVTMEAAREFRIGYAPDSWEATLQWGVSRGYTPQVLESAGLVIAREGGGYYDRFRGRLMFPICDEMGRVVGFSGRVLAGDEKTAKYVNSPESPIFTKGRVLYGLHKTKRAIVEAGRAIVCEGQLDLIACHMAGVQNVVAPQGTAFTSDHGRILKRYADEVVLCFDADAAGQSAAVRSVDELLAAGLVVKVASIPAGHDPDSLAREEGADKLRAVIAAARPFFDFHLDYLCARHDLNSDVGKVQISHALAESLVRVTNAVLRASYVQRSAARLGVPESALLEEMAKIRRAPERREQPSALPPAPISQRPAPLAAEKMLLQQVLRSPDLMASACARLDPAWLTNSVAGEMLAAIHRLHGHGQWQGTVQLLDAFPDDQPLLAELLLDPAPTPEPAQVVDDCLRALRDRWTKLRISQLTQQLHQEGLSAEAINCIQKQILDLRKLDMDSVRFSARRA
ncbi:MAG: DNA primase [Verrucomicrobiae bacterium]|nr:DNA primase [Verrucomicrobiae bacterium]